MESTSEPEPKQERCKHLNYERHQTGGDHWQIRCRDCGKVIEYGV